MKSTQERPIAASPTDPAVDITPIAPTGPSAPLRVSSAVEAEVRRGHSTCLAPMVGQCQPQSPDGQVVLFHLFPLAGAVPTLGLPRSGDGS